MGRYLEQIAGSPLFLKMVMFKLNGRLLDVSCLSSIKLKKLHAIFFQYSLAQFPKIHRDLSKGPGTSATCILLNSNVNYLRNAFTGDPGLAVGFISGIVRWGNCARRVMGNVSSVDFRFYIFVILELLAFEVFYAIVALYIF